MPDAVAIAIVVFAVSISMAKILAKKLDYEVDANQVCIQRVFYNSLLWCINVDYIVLDQMQSKEQEKLSAKQK